MISLRSTNTFCLQAASFSRFTCRRYLQTHLQSTVAVPHFDPASLPKSKVGSSSEIPSEPHGLLWQRHGLADASAEAPESDFLSSIFDSENPPSKAELAKLLSEAKKASTNSPPVAVKAANRVPEIQKDDKVPDVISPSAESAPAKKQYRTFKPRKAALTMTPNAVSHIRDLLAQPEPKLLRIGVRNRGCSGLQYHLEYVDAPGKFDEEVVQDGVRVLIDSKALFSIIGSEMDWVDDKLSNRFVFHNPNIKDECGCGESFSV